MTSQNKTYWQNKAQMATQMLEIVQLRANEAAKSADYWQASFQLLSNKLASAEQRLLNKELEIDLNKEFEIERLKLERDELMRTLKGRDVLDAHSEGGGCMFKDPETEQPHPVTPDEAVEVLRGTLTPKVKLTKVLRGRLTHDGQASSSEEPTAGPWNDAEEPPSDFGDSEYYENTRGTRLLP